MLENIFFNNPILNFLPSLIFLITLFVASNFFSIYLEKNKILKKDLINPVIIFIINLAILTSLINYTFLINANIKYIIFFFIIANFIFLIILINKLDYNFFLNLQNYSFNKFDFFILSLLIVLLIICLFPVSDADSIAIHLNFPYRILNYDFLPNNPKNLELRVFSSTESLLFLSLILKSDNFGSILNFLTLVIFINYFYLKKKNIINIFILSSPLIIFFISTQKLQLFFAFIYLSVIISLYEKKSFKNLDLIFIAILINFFVSGKISYALVGLPLFLFSIIKIKNLHKIKKFIFYNIVFFLIIYFPILLKKFLFFGDPFSPFFEFLKNDSIDVVKNLAYSYRFSEGWYLSEKNFLLIFLRLFMPLQVHQLASSLGIIFISIFLFKLFKSKKDFYILIIISFLMIFVTGQLLPRYFLEIYLFICFIIGNLKISPTIMLLKKISFIQIMIILIFSFSFMTIGLSKLYPFKNKIKYQTNFSYSFFNAFQLNKLNLKRNVLNLNSDRDTIFFDDNVYSSRSINIMKEFSNNKNYFADFIKLNNIEYIVSSKDIKIPGCIKTKYLKELSHLKATRNFLRKSSENKLILSRVMGINCSYD